MTKLLIVTQKADRNDPVLGFMHGWIEEFAKQCEKVSVVCLEKRETHFPQNVSVFSLGKEQNNFQFSIINFTIFKKLKYSIRFLRYIWSTRRNYDVVFVHMNPEYVVLGGLFWKLFGKKVGFWYAHKSVTWSLRLAVWFCDIIFTSTKSGFRLPNGKVKVVGQGIDTSKFKMKSEKLKMEEGEGIFRIISVGRITPSKDYETLIEAIEKLVGRGLIFEVRIIGPSILDSDKKYLDDLKEKISRKKLENVIKILPPVSNTELPEILAGYDLFVNMGRTGSLDKAVPEAMAVGLPILTSNEAFKEVLGSFKEGLMYEKSDSKELAFKMEGLMSKTREERKKLGEKLREIVVREHSLELFVKKILKPFQ